ncbi:MAG TPA: ABC transporter ATP-binding protein [Chloroflexia bacterium]|nr:ABC transporter ATP-binding protein [Chloroflexia bacterium]
MDEQVNRGGARRPGALPGAPATGEDNTPRVKVIKFSHVSKRFILHQQRVASFQEMLTGLVGRGRRLTKPPPELAPPARDFWALRDVNFSVYAGEALGIIGENGSGKSTTLKLISRILYASEGSVSVRGKVSALLELGTGFHPDLSGRENIYLNGSLLGLNHRQMDARYESIVQFAELEQFIDTPIKHWSSGMVMRLGFAVAINVDPDILITDEVLAVGDESFQRKCLEQIAAFRRSGRTIIFVSHALDAVRGLCSRVIWLDHGVVRADGPAATVIDKYLDYANDRHRVRLLAEYAARHAAPPATTDAGTAAELDAPEDVAPAAEGELPAAETGRWGTGQVSITDVTFLDAEGAPGNVFTTGDRVVIRIYFHAERRVPHPVFGLAIYTEGGAHLNGPNTRFAGYDVPFIEGDGHIDYVIPSLPLLGGVYDLTVAAVDAEMTETFDHQHRRYHFVVQPNSALPERWGILYIPGDWQIGACDVR